jgi:hypothetical protein
MSTIGTGYETYKGLFYKGSPLVMITYGVVQACGLEEPKEVVSRATTYLVKSINIFPLPGEWELMVVFYSKVSGAKTLRFSPYAFSLPYTTRMIPINNANGKVC